MGLRNKKLGYTSAALKSKQRAMHMQMEKRATLRRLTEINRRVSTMTSPPRGGLGGRPPNLPREGSSWSFSRVAFESMGRMRKKQPPKEEVV